MLAALSSLVPYPSGYHPQPIPPFIPLKPAHGHGHIAGIYNFQSCAPGNHKPYSMRYFYCMLNANLTNKNISGKI